VHGGAAMMPLRLIPPWLVAVTALLLGVVAGAAVTAAVKDKALAQLREQHANARLTAALQSVARLQAALARGDQLTRDLHQAHAATLALQDRLDHEIARVTTGRACLGADALGLLDRAAAGPQPAAKTTGQPAAAYASEPAAAASQRTRPQVGDINVADSPDDAVASDTDVTRWANTAYAQYAQCAQRLNALIDWHIDPHAPDVHP